MNNLKKFDSPKKIKIALVGCGRISKRHINGIIQQYNRCELVALCDTSTEKIKTLLEFYEEELERKSITKKDLQKFDSYENLIKYHEQNKIDLIVLTTPSGMHSKQAIIAANSGINVCTEKPMALKLNDAREMIKACQSNNVKLFVVKQNRLNPTLQALKKCVRDGNFGKIAIVDINVFWQRPQSYYDQDEWRGTWSLDGGALLNQASHYVDLLEWIIGPLEGLYATTSTISRKIEVEDTAVLHLKWANGTLGSMSVTMITYPKNLEGSITIIGDKGSVKIGGIATNKVEYAFFEDDPKNETFRNLDYPTDSVYGFGHFKYYENMFNALEGKEEPICDGYSGLSSIKIIEAAYESAKSKKYLTIN